ncbi:MAG TPA: MopE-related protein [Myxococcota bacterium]|nr:MopE-related protein [Myxococcota bacterium]
MGIFAGGCVRTPGGGGTDAGNNPYDQDGDGILVPGDCDDTDPNNFPGNVEVLDGADNDCDGVADDGLPGVDADGDGFTAPADCNDANPAINPMATEIANSQDDDCDGMIDEAGAGHVPCDCGGGVSSYATALGMCEGLLSESSTGPAMAKEIMTGWTASFAPVEGCTMIHLASGESPSNQPGGYTTDPGCDFDGTGNCSTDPFSSDGPANDEVTVTLQFTVPQGANTLSWDFSFFSVEWPEWVMAGFNDTFEANITSTMFNGNASFDETGAPVTVDNVLFDTTCDSTACDPVVLGTRYDDTTGGGGTTNWLRTETPVVPGETVSLTFRLYDVGDGILDSAVVIDNLVFDAGFTEGGPGTNPIQ